MGVKIEFGGVRKKAHAKRQRVQTVVSQQVLKDSNYFAPQDTSTLINSSLIASDFERGKLMWDVPYARRLYWNPQYNFSKDRNPNARGMWFEAAKGMFLSDWIAMGQEEADK